MSKVILGNTPRRVPATSKVRPPTSSGESTLTNIETYTGNPGTNPHPWKIPSAAQSGDLVLAAISMQDAGGSVTSLPSGWTLEWSGSGNSAAQYLYSRVLDGTENYSDTWSTIGSTKVSAAWWGVKANGATLTTTVAVATSSDDPPAVSPPSNGDYWVFPLTFKNKGEPDPDVTGALSTGFELLVYLTSNATSPSTFAAQLFLQKDKRTLTGNVDPDAIGWNSTSGGRTSNSLTVLVKAQAISAEIATADHTHVEADVTDLDHWTETDHDALDHTGLTGVGASDHGALTGLADDDHTQYSKADGTRAFIGEVAGVTPTVDASLATKGYVDSNSGATILHGATPQSDGSLRFTYGVDSSGRPTYTAAGTTDTEAIVILDDYGRAVAREVTL